MVIEKICQVCGKHHKINVDTAKFEKYINGELIQNCFPDMTDSEREIILSGTCPECWDELFEEYD